jgi:hypothetical protein
VEKYLQGGLCYPFRGRQAKNEKRLLDAQGKLTHFLHPEDIAVPFRADGPILSSASSLMRAVA